ncbi:MAG: hypothetical protein QME41_02695 [Actinomycetota bacterium]|nr:hypothetical protein [Actinomycetota bacterium]
MKRLEYPILTLGLVMCFVMLIMNTANVTAQPNGPAPPDSTKIRASQAQDGTVTVTGVDNAVIPGSTVVVVNPNAPAVTDESANVNGGFSAGIRAKTGDTIYIYYRTPDGQGGFKTSDMIKIKVPGTSWLKRFLNTLIKPFEIVVELVGDLVDFTKKVRGLKDKCHLCHNNDLGPLCTQDSQSAACDDCHNSTHDSGNNLTQSMSNQRFDAQVLLKEPADGLMSTVISSPLEVNLPDGITLAGQISISTTGDILLGTVSGNSHGSNQILIPLISSGGDGVADSIVMDFLSASVDVSPTAPLGTAVATLSDANGLLATLPVEIVGDREHLDPNLIHNRFATTFDSEGGSITNDIGDSINIPKDALSATTLISFETILAPSPTSGLSGSGRIAAARKFEPSPLDFSRSITITMPYSDNDISGLQEDSLKAYSFDPATSSWNLIPDSTVNTEANTVTFQTTHFSIYGIGGDSLPDSSGIGFGYNTYVLLVSSLLLMCTGYYLVLRARRKSA